MLRPSQMSGFEGWLTEIPAVLRSVCLGFASVRVSLRSRCDDHLVVAASILTAHLVGILALFSLFDKTLTLDAVRYVGLVLPAAVVVLAYGVHLLPRPLAIVGFVAVIAFQAAQLRYGRDLDGLTARRITQHVLPGSTVVVGAGHGNDLLAPSTPSQAQPSRPA